MLNKFNSTRRHFLQAAAMTIPPTQFGRIASAMTLLGSRSDLSALQGATAWLNSQPLTNADLGGKIVVVEFWTYSCINWRRQLPYVRAWAEKYNDGLIVVGVHSPEFSFEKDIENIRWAAGDMRVGYPIAVDNDHAVWRGFNNEYWPALYFVDAKGKIRHRQLGEGGYDQSERVIQNLLAEVGNITARNELAPVVARGAEAAADWKDLQSGENYLGYARTENFASTTSKDKPRVYSVPKRLGLNNWALSGDWTAGQEAIRLNQPSGRIVYRFHARDLHLVMGPPAAGTPVPFRVLIDGHPSGNARGADVDEQGKGTVIEPRMYQLIRQQPPIIDREFEIQFLAAGVEVFSFTFG